MQTMRNTETNVDAATTTATAAAAATAMSFMLQNRSLDLSYYIDQADWGQVRRLAVRCTAVLDGFPRHRRQTEIVIDVGLTNTLSNERLINPKGAAGKYEWGVWLCEGEEDDSIFIRWFLVCFCSVHASSPDERPSTHSSGCRFNTIPSVQHQALIICKLIIVTVHTIHTICIPSVQVVPVISFFYIYILIYIAKTLFTLYAQNRSLPLPPPQKKTNNNRATRTRMNFYTKTKIANVEHQINLTNILI